MQVIKANKAVDEQAQAPTTCKRDYDDVLIIVVILDISTIVCIRYVVSNNEDMVVFI